MAKQSMLRFVTLNGDSPKATIGRLMVAIFALVLVMGAGAVFAVFGQYKHHVNSLLEHKSIEIKREYDLLMQGQVKQLVMTLEPIVADKSVAKALRNGDANGLLTHWRDVFSRMKTNAHLSHFYFLDKDRVALLRLHQPLRKGDKIERFTMLEAERKGTLTHGLEMGVMGHLTLRAVQPVYDENGLAGYVELGKEIEDVLATIKPKNAVELAIVSKKSHLRRDDWEEGMRLLGREPVWNRFEKTALVYSSTKELNPALMDVVHLYEHNKIDSFATHKNGGWQFFLMPIFDASKQEVAALFVVMDTAFEQALFVDFLKKNIALAFLCVGAVLAVIFFLLRHTASVLHIQQAKVTEAKERFEEVGIWSRTVAWEVDVDGLYTYLSSAAYHVWGYHPEELVYKKHSYDLHPKVGQESFRGSTMAQFAKRESFNDFHNLIVHANGSHMWMSTSGVPIFGSDGVFAGYRGSDVDITVRKLSEEKAEQLSFFDPLTKLPNRTLFVDRLKQAMFTSGRNMHHCALLLIDLDDFKTLNDSLGHEIGDVLLQHVAKRLLSSVRNGDTVARFGGDEFVVVLTELGENAQEAALMAESIGVKILASLREPYQLADINHQSGASMGITLFLGDSVLVEELMRQADMAMYRSKESGRNLLSFFDPQMEDGLKSRLLLEDDLRNAVANGEFELYFQPQVDDSAGVVGVEALVRWKHPKGMGMVSPAEFIPVAERSGIILSIGQWVLEEACRQIVKWSQDEQTRGLSVAVNVSAKQFKESSFVQNVLFALSASGANPSALKLELTESLLVDDVENVILKMNSLREIGIKFSLDDFGTGYSSLAYLKRLPLDQLKIDQGFVRDIMTDANDEIICRSTIVLAQSMGLDVIAEGVETNQQREILSSLGCHLYQGYLFSPPLCSKEFENWVQNITI